MGGAKRPAPLDRVDIFMGIGLDGFGDVFGNSGGFGNKKSHHNTILKACSTRLGGGFKYFLFWTPTRGRFPI